MFTITNQDRDELNALANGAWFGCKLTLSLMVCAALSLSIFGGMMVPDALDAIWGD